MDRGAWQAPVHGVTKSWTQLSNATTTTTWSPTSSLCFKPSHSMPSQALGPSCLFQGKPSMGNRVIDLPTSTYSEALLSHPLPPATLAGLLIPAVQVSSGKEILGLVCQHCPSALCPSLACAARMIIHSGSLGFFVFLTIPWGMQDLIPTSDRTHAPLHWERRVLTTGWPGKSL